jgi:large subunit ribosomal protein L18
MFMNAKKVKKGMRLPFKRRMESKTDYKRRLDLLKSGRPRLVLRKANDSLHLQIVKFEHAGDKTLIEVGSKALSKFGWTLHAGSIPAAYLAGYMIGKKAVEAGIEEAVLDIGLRSATKGSSLFAAAKGAADAGLDLPLSEEAVPDEKRLTGEHIAAYAKKLKSDAAAYAKQFGASKDAERAPELFAAVKKKLGEAGKAQQKGK